MRRLIGALCFVGCAVGLASAADQPILGKQFQLKDPKPGVNAAKRTLTGQAHEKGTAHTIVGDPTLTGASLTVFTAGGSPGSQTYALPASLWKAKSGSLKYNDAKLTAGAVKTLTMKKSKTAFDLKATVSGKNGGIALVPPNPGRGVCLRFEIAGGDRYDVLFLAPPESTIKTNDAKTFAIKAPTVIGTCEGLEVDPAGTDHTYVVSALDVPSNGSEAAALGFDLDGKANDGVDNQLGSVLGSLQALMPTLDVQAAFDEQIDRGALVLLANVKATALDDATRVGTWLYAGTDVMTPPACTGPGDLVCRQQFAGTGQFHVDPTGPADAKAAGAITAGHFSGTGSDLAVRVVFAGEAMTFRLQKARLEISGISASGWAGKLGGAVSQTDIQSMVMPAIATIVRASFDADCDVGGTPPNCGCTAASTGASLRNLFDKAPTQDCVISDLEVQTVVNGFLTPDIDLDGDGINDALSIGVGLTAVAGTFTVP